MGGRITDDAQLLRIELQSDRAYIDGLLRAFRDPHNARRTIKSSKPGNTQDAFRKSLIKHYEAEDVPQSPQPLLWCPIAGQFLEKMVVRAAHITNKNVGENAAQALFGEQTDPLGHIWQPSNGLLMHYRYERLWDAGAIAIVPAEDAENEFQVLVLDMSAFEPHRGLDIPYGADLHGRRLQFRGNFRPAKRCLYFKHAVNLLRHQRTKGPGSAFDREKLPEKAKELWLTPGSYLTRSMLVHLARQIGYLTPDEAAEFWGMPGGATLDDDERLSLTLAGNVRLALSARQRKHKHSKDDEGYGDDDDYATDGVDEDGASDDDEPVGE